MNRLVSGCEDEAWEWSNEAGHTRSGGGVLSDGRRTPTKRAPGQRPAICGRGAHRSAEAHGPQDPKHRARRVGKAAKAARVSRITRLNTT
jgi:hypothetical protein